MLLFGLSGFLKAFLGKRNNVRSFETAQKIIRRNMEDSYRNAQPSTMGDVVGGVSVTTSIAPR